MKTFIIMSLLLFVGACGKKNESGKPYSSPYIENVSPYTEVELEEIRQDFLREGRELLSRYQNEILRTFGPRPVRLIRERLLRENIDLSEAPIYGEHQTYVRSSNRNSLITLYVGREQTNLNWSNYHRTRPTQYTRWVMHELLLLGDIDDVNFIFTDRILRR